MNMIFSKYKFVKSNQSNIKPENILIQNTNVNTNVNTNQFSNINTPENNKFIGSVRFGMIDRILYNNTNCKSCGK
jgi:hypothetical protein